MKFPYFLLIGAALAFASCNNDKSAAEATEDMAEGMEDGVENMAGDMPAEMSNDAAGAMNYFNETVTAVSGVGGDITAIPAATAVSNIDGWIQRLQGKDGMYEIVEGLNELKEKLTDPNGIDGKAVGTVLNSLAEDTAELNNPTLAPLSNVLAAGGKKLGGM